MSTLDFTSSIDDTVLQTFCEGMAQADWPAIASFRLRHKGFISGIHTELLAGGNWALLESISLSAGQSITRDGLPRLAQGKWPLLTSVNLLQRSSFSKHVARPLLASWPWLKVRLIQLNS